MNRHHAFVVLGVGLILLGVAAVLGGATCSGLNWNFGDWGSPSVNGVSLPHRATLTLSSKARPARFTLSVSAGKIVVEGDPTVTGIEAVFEVNEKTPGDASIAAGADTIDVKSASGAPVFVGSAKIRVPPGTPVVVSADAGSVTVAGIGGVDEVSATSDVGEVTLRALKDVKKVTGTTNVGSVRATDVHAETARFSSDVGEVRIEDSDFGHVSAHADVGSVRLKRCTYRTKDTDTDVGDVRDEK